MLMVTFPLRRCRPAVLCLLVCIAQFLLVTRGSETQAAVAMVKDVPKQPLMVHVDRLMRALAFLGHPISDADRAQIDAAAREPDGAAIEKVQEVLDRHVLFGIEIDPIRNLTVVPSSATESLTKNSWSTFLVKVHN